MEVQSGGIYGGAAAARPEARIAVTVGGKPLACSPLAALTMVAVGLGRIVAVYWRASALYQTH
jgi:hypothetical protein